jgi:hypothetical protein
MGWHHLVKMKRQLPVEPAFLKLAELSRYSNLSKRTLWSFIRAGLPFYQKPGSHGGRGGAVLVKVDEFDSFMQRYRQGRDPKRIADELLR